MILYYPITSRFASEAQRGRPEFPEFLVNTFVPERRVRKRWGTPEGEQEGERPAFRAGKGQALAQTWFGVDELHRFQPRPLSALLQYTSHLAPGRAFPTCEPREDRPFDKLTCPEPFDKLMAPSTIKGLGRSGAARAYERRDHAVHVSRLVTCCNSPRKTQEAPENLSCWRRGKTDLRRRRGDDHCAVGRNGLSLSTYQLRSMRIRVREKCVG